MHGVTFGFGSRLGLRGRGRHLVRGVAHELDVGLDSGVGRLVRVRVRGRDKVRVRVRAVCAGQGPRGVGRLST